MAGSSRPRGIKNIARRRAYNALFNYARPRKLHCTAPNFCRSKGRGSAAPHNFSALRAFALSALHTHGDAHAAADAERGKTLLGVAALHLVQQRGQHARAGSTDRMADG